MTEKYNGWTNFETWNVALWLDNDYGTYRLMTEWAEATDDDSELADQIRDFIEENNPIIEQASTYTDLLNAALEEVNYLEIAEHYRER